MKNKKFETERLKWIADNPGFEENELRAFFAGYDAASKTTIAYSDQYEEKDRIFPKHKLVEHCVFDVNDQEEAELYCCIAEVAEKNNVQQNDLGHLFPAILRMLKSTINWSK